jgi:hypothetical protein
MYVYIYYEGQYWIIHWGEEPKEQFNFGKYVHLRGGEYFFLPSITGIRFICGVLSSHSLASFSSPTSISTSATHTTTHSMSKNEKQQQSEQREESNNISQSLSIKTQQLQTSSNGTSRRRSKRTSKRQ